MGSLHIFSSFYSNNPALYVKHTIVGFDYTQSGIIYFLYSFTGKNIEKIMFTENF